MNQILYRFSRVSLLVLLAAVSIFSPQSSVFAAATLTVTPITWNVVGLDSNNVAVGPNNFPVGVRICNTGDVAATKVSASFEWDTSDTYINLRDGSLNPIKLDSLAAGSCSDFYYEVSVTRDSNAYDHVRRYHIAVVADGGVSASSPTPREIYVERLVSQSRNYTNDVKLDGTSIPAGGMMALVVGQTYNIELIGSTATNGYEQIETFINFPNTIFHVLSVSTTYTADTSSNVTSPDDKLYGNGCTWENDPNSPNYRSCLGVGKAGGGITVTYHVKVIGGEGTTQNLNTLIYDFSGSSYHYNADYSVSSRIAYIVDPTAATISKNFSPDPTNVNGVSTLTFTLTNPTPATISGLNFTDNLPASPGAMVVANPPNASTTNCGTPTFAPTAGAASVSFSNGILAPNSACTIKVNVTVPAIGTYTNTTSHLFINSTDTGNYAVDTLTVDNAPAPPPPVCGQILAQWTFDEFMTNPPPQPTPFKAANVTTAAISVGGTEPLTTEADTTSGSPASPSILTYGWAKTGPLDTATFPYLQFAIDTSKYIQVNFQFNATRKNNGPDSDSIHYSTDGLTWNLKSSFSPTTSWTSYGPYDFTGQTSTTGVTYFRIYGFGANTTSKGSDMNFDNITFTGCSSPKPPTIAKSFSPNPVKIGDSSTLTFVLTNPNTGVTLNSINFSDTLPSGLTVASGSSSPCSGTLTTTAPQTISFSGGTLAAGASCDVSVTVNTSAAGVYDNVSGFVSSTEGGTNTSPTGIATSSLKVLKPPSISKLFAPNPIIVNGESILTFTITNPNMDDALTGVAFSDTYPLGVVNAAPLTTGNSCVGPLTAIEGGNSVSLSGGTVPAGGSCAVTIKVTATSADTYPNTSGNVSSTNAGTGNTASDTLTVNAPHPAISLLKQVSTSDTGPWSKFIGVNIGDNVYYQFTVENIGDVDLTGVNVTDSTLGLSLADCSWPSLAKYDSKTCVVGPISALAGKWTNTATAHGAYGLTEYNSTSSAATYATASLAIVKNVTESSFSAAGDVLHYSFTVTNNGSAPLIGPVVVSDDKATDESCPDVNTVGDNDAYLDPGESVTCTATYTVTASDITTGSVTNEAYATVDGLDSPTVNKTVPLKAADLIVTKTNNTSDVATVGATFTWTLAISNIGSLDATFDIGQTIVRDPLPANATYGAPTAGNFIAITNSGNLSCSIDGANILTCNASGAPVTIGATTGSFTVSFDVTPTVAGSLPNIATVDPDSNIIETDETNNQGSNTVTAFAPSLNIIKEVSTDGATWNDASVTVNVGDTVYYRVRVENTGDVTLTGLTVADPNCTLTRGTDITGDNDSDFEAGEEWSYTCNLIAVAGTHNNTATADSIETPSDSDSASYEGQSDPDVIAKSVFDTNQLFTSENKVAIGEIVTYEVEFQIPPGVFNSVTLVDTLGRGLAFVDCDNIAAPNLTTSAGSFDDVCNNAAVDSMGSSDPEDVGRRVTYSFETVTNLGTSNETITIRYRAVVLDIDDNQDGDSLPNSAALTWEEGGLAPASATVSIVEPDLFIEKTADNLFISSGTEVTFTLTIGHTSLSHANAYDVVVQDILPDGLEYVDGSLNCSTGAQDPDAGTCVYEVGPLGERVIRARWSQFTLGGGTGLVVFRVRGASALTPTTGITNIASVAWTSLPDPIGNLPQSSNKYSTERDYDPANPADVYGTSSSLGLNSVIGGAGLPSDTSPSGFRIPITGFAPNQLTDLSAAPSPNFIHLGGLTLEIPALKLSVPVTGVRLENGMWDVNWLQGQIGWLEKTAYPTFPGNSVLTAHVVGADGKPGPFARLRMLGVGERIVITLGGYRHIYIVRSSGKVKPDDISVLAHKETPWLTLITCDSYEAKSESYLYRFVARAELVEIVSPQK